VIEHSNLKPDFDIFKIRILKNKSRAQTASQQFQSNAYRLINGEVDQFPGLTIDIFDNLAVFTSYLPAWDPIIDFLFQIIKEQKFI